MNMQRSLAVLMAALLSAYLLWDAPRAATGSRAAVSDIPARLHSSARPSAAQAQKRKVRLEVTVKDPAGKAVGNARVNVWHDRVGPLGGTPDYQGDTTPEGIAVIEVVTTGGFFSGKAELHLVIRVVKTDFEVKEDKLNLSGNVPDEVTRTVIIRRFAVQSGEMTMKVRVETWDGRPVAGAGVVVWANTWPTRKQFTGTTDVSGVAEVRAMQYDDFELKATKEGLGEASLPVKLPGTGEAPTGYFTVRLPKPNGTVVTILVRDEKSQQGVADALVRVDGSRPYHGVTGADGRAIIVIPEAGVLAVNISQRTYEELSGAEVSLSDAEREKTFEFALKPKHAKEGEGQNSVEVTVLAADKTDHTAVARANLPLPFASVKVGRTTAPTDAGGRVKIYGDFEGDVEVAVEAEGYQRQVRKVRVTPTVRFSGSHASATFLMQAEGGRDYVEVTVVADDEKCFRHCRPVEGVAITAGGTSATTDADGKAILYGIFDDENVRAQKAGYKTQAQQVSSTRSSDGARRGALTFRLKPESAEATVEVLVFGVSPNGGGTFPLSQAAVKIGQAVGSTDEDGRVSLKGDFGNEASVTVQAKGYARQSTKVSIGGHPRKAAASLYLQPEMPLRLIVEVRESAKPDSPLAGALVHLRDPQHPVQGTAPLAVQETNAKGEAVIELRGGEEELAKIRAGLRLHVGKEKYLPKLSDVAADLLLPSAEARRVTVYLERDWAELQQAVAALEQKVLAWNNDLTAARQAAARVFKLAEQAPQARERAAASLREIEFAGQALAGVNGISSAALQCRGAARLRSSIQAYRIEADAKEQAIKSLLDTGATMAARCAAPQDGDAIRALFRNATQLARAVNELEKKALIESDELKSLAGNNKDLTKIMVEVEKKVNEIAQEATRAEAAARAAGADFVSADNLNKSVGARHGQLSGELAALKARYGLDKFVEGLPPDLDRRVEVMTQLLGKENNNVFGGPNADWPKAVQEAAAQIQAARTRAEQLLAAYKSGAGAGCDFEPMDDAVQQIGAIQAGITVELGAAALNEKAEACIMKGNCQPLSNDALALLEQGAIEPAEAKINEARAKGCDVGGLNQQLDYWKSLRDGVVYLKVLEGRCEYREAHEVSLKIPASIRGKSLMAETVARVFNGLKAQERIGALRRSAQAEVARTNKVSAAEPFIREAEQVAAGYECLAREASRFRDEYRLTGTNPKPLATGSPVEKPVVEEIPEEAAGAGEILSNVNREGPGKIEVEEIPEGVFERPARTGKTGRAGDRRGGRPVVEEIPEEESAGTGAGGRPPRGRNNPPPAVEEIPEEAATTGNAGQRPPETQNPQKPQRTGRKSDDIWTKLGRATREALNGGTQPPGNEQPPVNNPPPGVRPCNADEAAHFARMTGTWQTRMGPKMVIGGSCESASGTSFFAEYCENPDATYNASLPRYQANFTGRMNGDYLQFEWTRPNRPDKGTGSCRVSGDGTLSCSGVPCGMSGQRK